MANKEKEFNALIVRRNEDKQFYIQNRKKSISSLIKKGNFNKGLLFIYKL